MNDPWHQETLEKLITAIEAARAGGGTAYVAVVASSERLGGEVAGELRARLHDVEGLRVCTYVDPRSVIRRRLDEPKQQSFRTTIIEGLPTVLESERGNGLLGWLNFNREAFSRPGEAFVFVLAREAADRWVKEAPDLDRYTAHFGFEDWDDLVEVAERAAAKTELVGEDGQARLRQAKERSSQARKLGGDFLADSLLKLGHLEMSTGRYSDAERTLTEAWSLTEKSHGALRGMVVLAHVYLLLEQGHPDEALRALRSVDGESIDPTSMAVAFSEAFWHLGKPEEASSYAAQDLALGPFVSMGATLEALVETMKELRQEAHQGYSAGVVDSLVTLASASLDAARPRRTLEIFDEARALPGSQSGRDWYFAIPCAKAQWTLRGPSAVTSLVFEEGQRQRGWTAPLPAAALAYIRGLASTNDDDTRRHMQDAAERFRTASLKIRHYDAERWLARLDRFQGDLDHPSARIEEALAWHTQQGARTLEARDRTELAMIALGRRDPQPARDQALQALDLIRACGTRIYEPAALVALAAAERALGNLDSAVSRDTRWRRLVRGIDAKGLEAALERDAAWANAQATD